VSFARIVDRQQAAVFRSLGEDATWSGVADPVRIRCAERDDLADWQASRAVARTRFVRVRQSDVAQPAPDDIVTRTETGELLKVFGEPTLDRKRVWMCQVAPVAP
jgi:hypothetical protein